MSCQQSGDHLEKITNYQHGLYLIADKKGNLRQLKITVETWFLKLITLIIVTHLKGVQGNTVRSLIASVLHQYIPFKIKLLYTCF